MNGVNKVILVGTLGRDPEVRFTPSGIAIANLIVATSEQWTDKQSGQKQDRTEWHRVVVFGKLAEMSKQYLKKGNKAYIEGKLMTRKWLDQAGQDRYSTEVILDSSGIIQIVGEIGDLSGSASSISLTSNSTRKRNEFDDATFPFQ